MDNVVKSDFQFTNPKLTKMIFEPNEGFSRPEGEEKVDTPIELQTEAKRNSEEKIAFVRLLCKVGGQSEQFPFYIEAAMEAKFKWADCYDEETVDRLLSRNAPSLLLGYLRPYIAQITEASPFPTMHIPFLDFSQSFQK